MRRTLPVPPVAMALFLTALTACALQDRPATSPDEVPETERYGGTAVIGANLDIDDINPITWTSGYAQDLQQVVLFTPLLRYDAALAAEPYGAEAWELDADTTALTFRLRRDLFWHDGRPTTAHDWKLAYDLARDPAAGFLYPSYWTNYAEAEAVDSFTFRVRMRPHAEFLDPWTAFAPVPAHLLAAVAPAELRRHPYGTTHPVGNGPFRFVSRAPGRSWTFEANERFPEALGGRPYLDRLVWRVIPAQVSLLTELLTERIHFYHRPPADQAERIRSSEVARLLEFVDRAYLHVEWNQRRPPFDDVRVRRALTLATDRQRIVDVARNGYADVANSPVPPMLWQHDSTAGADLGHDPERARGLLAEAGYADRDGGGVLEGPDGKPFRFTLRTSHANPERSAAGQIIQADLREVGIDVRVVLEEFNTLVARVFDVERRDFDAAIFTNAVEHRVDDRHLFHCESREQRMNMVGHCDPATDRLLDTLPRIADRSAALPLWKEYQKRIAAAQPYTFLFYPRQLAGVSRRLHGARPDVHSDFSGVERWWLDRRPASAGRTD